MKLKKQIIINQDCLKEKQFASVPDFVRWALQVNGVDYDKFKEQMTAIYNFEDKSYSFTLKEVYKALFTSDPVRNLQFLPDEFAVQHGNKLFNKNLNTYKVAVQKSAGKPGMVLKLTEKVNMTDGREKEELTTLNFSDNHLTLERKYNADLGRNFDKKTSSCNNYGRDQINYEFRFDEMNQITKYGYYRHSSESASWDRTKLMDMLNQNETDLTK